MGKKWGKGGKSSLFGVFSTLKINDTEQFFKIFRISWGWLEENLKKSITIYALCGAPSPPPNFLMCFKLDFKLCRLS